MCVNFRELNKITVFDPEPMMSPDDIFLKLAGSKIYVDDVLGHTENSSKRMEILRDFFERVKRANLCLRPSKCKVGFDQVKFLGHTLQRDCIKPQDESVGRILNTERPETKKSCRNLACLA